MKAVGKFVSMAVISFFLLSSALAFARVSPREIYKTRATAVVLIVASQEGSSSASAGTGSVIKEDGTVVTNCHVIFDENSKAPFPVIHVFVKPDRVTGDMEKDLSRHFTGKVLSYDRDLDLALLRIENPPAGLPLITFGDPEDVGPGDETVAIGHPEQGGLWTITTGVIGTEFNDFKGVAGKHVFQMETSLNRGNSGGPLFDVRGYQIGVNTAIARKGEGGIAITGVNFAVKSSVVKNWAEKFSVMIAYGTERISDSEDTRVAAAEKPREQPAPEKRASSATPSASGATSQEGKGVFRVEEGYGEEDGQAQEETAAASTPGKASTEVRRPVEQRPVEQRPTKHKPQRFEEHYRLPPHPYSFKRLFTEVDKVRARAKEAFDDLGKEERRRGR